MEKMSLFIFHMSSERVANNPRLFEGYVVIIMMPVCSKGGMNRINEQKIGFLEKNCTVSNFVSLLPGFVVGFGNLFFVQTVSILVFSITDSARVTRQKCICGRRRKWRN